MITTREKIDIMQAFIDGKEIEFKSKAVPGWTKVNNPEWDWHEFTYRVKPEPRPYNGVEEFAEASKEHGPFVRWKTDIDKELYMPISVGAKEVTFYGLKHTYSYEYKTVYEMCEWQDGTPCGIVAD